MKTSGFREIDFSKTECKNCGIDYDMFLQCRVPKGYVLKRELNQEFGSLNTSIRHYEKLVSCSVCKGTGFINESVTTELELE